MGVVGAEGWMQRDPCGPAAAVDGDVSRAAALVAEAQPACAAAIVVAGRDEIPAKMELPPKPRMEMPSLKKRLPFVHEFTAEGGN
ncbi:unnamed protein product [Lampetra fluviatilis]